jgi:PAP2 superfamily/PEP-CTERM motif
MRARLLAAAACLALVPALTSPAKATFSVDADPVLYWNQVLTQNVTGSPVLTSRSYSMVEVAIYDAVNATTGNLNHSYTGLAGSTGDTRAATSTAARDVLLFVLPANGTSARDAQRASIEAQYQASLALVPAGAAKTAGIATGAAAASGIIVKRTGDGSAAPAVPVYTPTNPPVDGHWQQTTPGALGAPVTPWWGDVTPWALNSGNQFQPGPPPDITSAEFASALAEVAAIGEFGSATRTPEQTASAKYWASAGNGLAPWINAAIAASAGKNFSSMKYAAMLALMSTNVADATIGVFDAKYTYDFWRPVTAIHDADPSSTWASLITAPSHPSYISGHSAVGGAAAVSLMYFLGDTDACFAGLGCFDNFELAAENGANSRLWGGIHYSFDNEAGLDLGHNVGNFGILAANFTAVPEPGTWLTILLGFGLVGWSVRRRPLSVGFSAAA